MTSGHDGEAEALGLFDHRQRLGQPAGFVELDIDGVVAAGERGERAKAEHTLVGADRHRVRDLCQRAVAAGRQRLFDQRHAGLRAGGEIDREIVVAPALVGIDDEFGVGRCRAHRGDARRVAVGAELDLEQCAAGGVRRCLGHRIRRGKRDRESGRHRMRGGKAGEVVHAASAAFGLVDPRRRSRARCARRRAASLVANPGASARPPVADASPRSPRRHSRRSRRSGNRARIRRARAPCRRPVRRPLPWPRSWRRG